MTSWWPPTQGAGCFGAAYELLFNTFLPATKAGLQGVKLTYVTAEPFLGHFGIGGLPHGESLLGIFLKKERIKPPCAVSLVDHVDAGALALGDGTSSGSASGWLCRRSLRPGSVRDPAAGRRERLRPGSGTYQCEKYDDVYAVGVGRAVEVPWQTAVAGRYSEDRLPDRGAGARGGARNIAAQVRGEAPEARPVR